MSSKPTFLNAELYSYLQQMSLRESPILSELREFTQNLDKSIMQIAPEQGQLMQLLVSLIGAKRCIEVGVFTGYSALSVASALPEDGKLIACDINEEWTNIAKQYWEKAGVSHKIDLHLAPAEQTLTQLLDNHEQESYDFAFIDADKRGYENYFELCLKLVRQNGLIILDNTFMHGGVLSQQSGEGAAAAIHRVNQKLLADARVDIAMIAVGDGMTLARKL